MKLLKAKIRNFRLLKDVEFQFSTDNQRNITVVRADNDSGKTTLHTALQWGLFGDDGLPAPRRNFRMSPIDSPNSEDVTIQVDLDYEIVVGDEKREQFRIVRFCTERPKEKDFDCFGTSNVKLFKITHDGYEEIDFPEVRINSHLPKDIQEVFFTDGDKALNFIKGANSEKKVENALKQMLGLNAIENIQNNVKMSQRKISKKIIDNSSIEEEIKKVYVDLENARETEAKLEESIKQKQEEIANVEKQLEDLDLKIADA